MIDRKPALVVECALVGDVVRSVGFAREAGLTVTARGGGHSVSGASLRDGGLVVDLSRMSKVTVDPERRVAHVEGGAKLGDLDAATQAHGLAVTAGVDPATGAGGLTLGGGVGFLVRKLGLTIDSMIGAEVVLANGEIVEASESENPDLFWALRGGGGQFGIVTRFDFALHDIGTEVVVAQAFYPYEEAELILKSFRAFMAGAPDEVGCDAVLVKVPPIDPFPEAFQGKPCAAIVACHAGDPAIGRSVLAPLLELAEPFFAFIGEQPYVEFQKSFAQSSPPGNRYYWKSHFLDDLHDEAIDLAVAWAREIPGEFTQLFIEGMGGAAGRVAPEATAFPHRKARYNLGISTGWVDPARDAEEMARTRSLFDALAPHASGGVYLNYVDRDEPGRQHAAFGENYARLMSIKQAYDPDSLIGGAVG